MSLGKTPCILTAKAESREPTWALDKLRHPLTLVVTSNYYFAVPD